MFWCNKSHAQTRCLQYIRCVLWVALVCRMQQDPEVIRIENMIDRSKRLAFQLDFIDVWGPDYRPLRAELDAVDAQIKEEMRAYDEKQARAAAAAADLEREAASERAKLLLTQMAFYEQQGSAYMIKACAQENPAQKLKAAKAALACFRQLHTVSSAHAEVSILISNAQKVADAAQAELDRPRVFKFLEFVCELLVTG